MHCKQIFDMSLIKTHYDTFQGLVHITTVFCPGLQKGRVPSEKGTLARSTPSKGHFSAVNGPSKGHFSAVN